MKKPNKKIVWLEIINFQSHAHTYIDNFSNYYNVIIGQSNKGKTSIIRALKFVFYNRPLGDSFIKRGETFMCVKVGMSDGTVIERYKSKGTENYYKLTYPDGREDIFTGFGSDVPPEVLAAHGMRQIKILNKKESINLSEQLGGMFMLSQTASQKSTIVSEISGTDAIDAAAKDASSSGKAIKKEVTATKTLIKEKTEALEQYEDLDASLNAIEKIEKDISSLEVTERSLQGVSQLAISLKREIARLSDIEDSILNNRKYYDLQPSVENLYESFRTLKTAERAVESLTGNVARLEALELSLKKNEHMPQLLLELEPIIEKFRKLDNVKDQLSSIETYESRVTKLEESLEKNKQFGEFIPKLEDLSKRFSDLSPIKNALFTMNQSVSRGERASSIVTTAEENMKTSACAYAEAVRASDICTVCFQPITEEIADNIAESLILKHSH